MSNYTTETYQTKREIINFTGIITKNCSKPVINQAMDFTYGILKNDSVLVSNIARASDSKAKLANKIDSMCHHLSTVADPFCNEMKRNYLKEIKKYIPKNPVILLDDSDIAKPYGKKFENLCDIVDASNPKKSTTKGYRVCEAVVLSTKEKQPLPVYSKVYSTISKGFKSEKDETMKSIDAVLSIIEKKGTFVCDRGYDDVKVFEKILNNGHDFVIRLKKTRNVTCKGKTKNTGELAKQRKGKIKMSMYFQNEKKECYVSHTRVGLKKIPGETFTLVIVYGLSEEEPMLLLTNLSVKSKQDVHQIVRDYFYRWRIETNFRTTKQVLGWEKIRIRNLKGFNTLNMYVMFCMGFVGIQAEKVNTKTMSILYVERSQTLRLDLCYWCGCILTGISEILKRACSGIEKYKHKRTRPTYKQLAFRI